MFNSNDLFGIGVEAIDKKYTAKVQIPQYLPSDEKPNLDSMFDDKKYRELVTAINQSNVTEEEKKFLKLAATRHIVFTYAKIADYYAHSNEEMQKLMEQSALVIIDIDDAIANGYVRLSENVKKIMQSTGRTTKSVSGEQ